MRSATSAWRAEIVMRPLTTAIRALTRTIRNMKNRYPPPPTALITTPAMAPPLRMVARSDDMEKLAIVSEASAEARIVSCTEAKKPRRLLPIILLTSTASEQIMKLRLTSKTAIIRRGRMRLIP